MASGDRQFAQSVSRWFASHGRDLPWRRRRTGYRAMVSEAMLQQTQVARVIERYREFIKRFPTARSLAAADEQEVLALWQGLGYYRRARLLHAAAQEIVREHRGRVPRDATTLRTLPGVGRYTAGAIASIVYGEDAPIVDGNVRRVLVRWHGGVREAGDETEEAWCWRRAGELVRAAKVPGEFNEGMMELGAMVCTPRGPSCAACPISKGCHARRSGDPEALPVANKAAARTIVHHHAVVTSRGGKLLLEQRPDTGMWSNMWQVPTVEAGGALEIDDVRGRIGVTLGAIVPCGRVRHVTTHRDITFHVYRASSRVRRGTWLELSELEALPMSNAQRKVLALAGVVTETGASSTKT